MAKSRPCYPGTTYLITRRCAGRRFFLNPRKLVFKVFVFVLAVAAKRQGILVHAVCVMGNHYHAVVTDPRGDIPAFLHYLHEFTSKCLNFRRGRMENMWAWKETSRVTLEDTASILDKIVYTLCNPVSSWVVSRAAEWTGLRMWWANEPVTVERPAYFSDVGAVPATATLVMVPPPAFSEMGDGGIELVSNALSEREKALREEARRKGIRFVGRRKLAKQRWQECPTSFAERMKISPRVATRNKWHRIAAIRRNKQFDLDYAEAMKEWRAGNRDVLFPYGTYKMRVLHNARCMAPPS